ncbi:hypothetical protein T05_10413 [Trichinella murrelli]|uniref:Uncharacterized protein n=1 Tax=Trichinella murrelli TaxID=144512 RepID=A0A0V0TID2_9BILA|nr:hypothetical protein T05_10413 [Trichinella murrelli]
MPQMLSQMNSLSDQGSELHDIAQLLAYAVLEQDNGHTRDGLCLVKSFRNAIVFLIWNVEPYEHFCWRKNSRRFLANRRTSLWLTDRLRFAFTDNRLSAELSRISVLNSSAKIPQFADRMYGGSSMTRTLDKHYRILTDTRRSVVAGSDITSAGFWTSGNQFLCHIYHSINSYFTYYVSLLTQNRWKQRITNYKWGPVMEQHPTTLGDDVNDYEVLKADLKKMFIPR